MIDNFVAFLKGLLWGFLASAMIFVIIAITGGLNSERFAELHISGFIFWALALCFTSGVVGAASSEGFGILSLILFILCLVALYIIAIAAMVEMNPKANGFYGAISGGLLGTTGALALFWYIIIGLGSGDGPQLMPTIIVCAVVMLIIGLIWNASVAWAKGVSIALGAIGPVGIIILRIKNGSALDY